MSPPSPSASQVESRVISIIREQIQPPADHPEITLSTSTRDQGADSLDQVEIIMELEEEFEVMIPDEVSEGWVTVADIVGWIERDVK